MNRLDITAAPVPCPAAAPTAAPAQYVDADGALRLSNGAEALCLYPSGTFCLCSELSHRMWWNPETCTPATSGVTLRLRHRADGPVDIAADARADMIARLDRMPPTEWRDAVAQEVIEAGGTFPLAYDATHDQLAEVALHGIAAHGISIDDAIDNWIALARTDLTAETGGLRCVTLETDTARFHRRLNRAAAAAGRTVK